MPSSDDDSCKIVENTPHDDEEFKTPINENVVASDDGEELNPFSSFAFGGSTLPAPGVRPSCGAKRKKVDNAAAKAPTSHSAGIKQSKTVKQAKAKAKEGGCKADGIGELSAEELGALRARWRGMADRDAGVEDQRFQVLVGAILSSRAQATVVDEGMSRMRAREGGLTAAALAGTGQEELAGILRHVHWNKAKAKHVRESAAMILRRHRGVVPRRRGDLLALPGVGPALVEILLNVFDNWGSDEASPPESGEATGGCEGGCIGDESYGGGGRGQDRQVDARGVGGGSGRGGDGGRLTVPGGRKRGEEVMKTEDGDRRDADRRSPGVDVDGGVAITKSKVVEAASAASKPGIAGGEDTSGVRGKVHAEDRHHGSFQGDAVWS